MKRITVGEVGNINCILYSMPGNMIGTLEKKKWIHPECMVSFLLGACRQGRFPSNFGLLG